MSGREWGAGSDWGLAIRRGGLRCARACVWTAASSRGGEEVVLRLPKEQNTAALPEVRGRFKGFGVSRV